MHVLGHSFSQKRQTSKPRDLHIRKISSGSSLSSDSSISMSMSAASMSSMSASTSTSSTPISAPASASSSSASLSPPNSGSTTRGPRSSPSPAGLDPLGLHPTFQPSFAPPRLCDRRLLSSPESYRLDESSSFFLDDDEDELPDVVEAATEEPEDYFGVQALERPVLPQSRWSASTVATLDSSSLCSDDDDTVHGSEEDEALDDDAVDQFIGHYYLQPASTPLDGHQSMPNFSHKRDTLPKRPAIRTLDSLEDFIKRGGWKRRGIVFQQEEFDGDDDAIYLF